MNRCTFYEGTFCPSQHGKLTPREPHDSVEVMQQAISGMVAILGLDNYSEKYLSDKTTFKDVLMIYCQ